MSLQKNVSKILRDKDERNLLTNIVFAFLIKGLSLILSMFSLPLYLHYFDNNTVLGFWFTVLSMLSWISVCDLGLGNGLRNDLTKAIANNDTLRGKKIVSSTYAILTILMTPILIVGCSVLSNLQLNNFFEVPSDLISPDIMYASVTILFCGIGIHFVLRTITSIIYAIQKSSINNLLSLITSALPLLYIVLAEKEMSIEENLLYLSIVHTIAINLPLALVTILLFTWGGISVYAPSLKWFNMKFAYGTLRVGLQFFFAQVFFMLLMSTNEIMVTKFFSPNDVVVYSIYNRIFTLVGSLFMLALTPVWSKITKDLALKRYQRIKSTNRLLYGFAIIAAIVEIFIVFVLQAAFRVWLGVDAIAVSYEIAFSFAVYGSMYILNIVLTTVANGMGKLHTQLFFYGVGAAVKIPVIALLRHYYPSWIIVIIYTSLVLLFFCAFQMRWLNNELKKLTQVDA